MRYPDKRLRPFTDEQIAAVNDAATGAVVLIRRGGSGDVWVWATVGPIREALATAKAWGNPDINFGGPTHFIAEATASPSEASERLLDMLAKHQIDDAT